MKGDNIMKKIIFMFKQLLPFTYSSKYTANGKHYVSIWRQWFFKPFDVTTFETK